MEFFKGDFSKAIFQRPIPKGGFQREFFKGKFQGGFFKGNFSKIDNFRLKRFTTEITKVLPKILIPIHFSKGILFEISDDLVIDSS